jgi:hypothetical protein
MIDTALRGWTSPPLYVIGRPDNTSECSHGEDHVFDGAHKVEALFDFIDNKFLFKSKTPKFSELSGKYFNEMSRDIQERIKKYRFHINHVDIETAGNPDELQLLWGRVNKAGKKLNNFELSLPIIAHLNDRVLSPEGAHFYETELFPKKISGRGELEQRLQLMLALTETDATNISSQAAIVNAWQMEKLGTTMAERTASIEANADRWIDILGRCRKMLEDLTQLNVFYDADGKSDIVDGLRKTELPFIMGRLARRFPRIETFRSQKATIASVLREKIFSKTPEAMLNFIGGTGRNGSYQKKLLRFVDSLVDGFVGIVQPRLFTKAQKQAKLKEQGGKCTACGEKILKHQLFDGDHVKEWSEGGETTLENLQILHRHCHQAKMSLA